MVAIASTYLPFDHLAAMLEEADPSIKAVVWPDPECLNAEVVACLHPPAQLYKQMPNLKLIHCVSAGVDSILVNQTIGQTPICRTVAPTLAVGVFQYALWAVLYFHRKFDEALHNHRKAAWVRQPRFAAGSVHVGVMGIGEIGGVVASGLNDLGYVVSGWSRTKKSRAGIKSFYGKDSLSAFLADVDVLICTLPLTDDTRGILDWRLFKLMKSGAALVHCGRGEQLNAPDLIQAIESGHLRGAVLDVAPQEPLPAGDALWSTPRVLITPHMASTASDKEIVEQLLENIGRMREGRSLLHVVDVHRGY